MAMGRDEAIAMLREGHTVVLALVEGLREESARRPGLGGGAWSIKDLLGHLTSWEEHALEALEAWEQGNRPAVHEAFELMGLDALNQKTHEAKARLSYAEVLSAFESVHHRLIKALDALTEEAWVSEPPHGRGRSLGEELGGILGGPGAFDHHESHLAELREWLVKLR